MKKFSVKKIFISIATLIAIYQSFQFEFVQKLCIELLVKGISPYEISVGEIKTSGQFPFRGSVKNLTLVKNREPIATFKNFLWDIPNFSFKNIVLNVDECIVAKQSDSVDFDFSLFSSSTIGYSLQNVSKKLRRFSSINIGRLCFDNKNLFFQLKHQVSEWVVVVSQKQEELKLILGQNEDYSTLHLDGIWEGQQLSGDAKIKDDIIDLSLKMNINFFANEHIANFFGPEILLTAHLEKLNDWQLSPLMVQTSKGHILQGQCAQRNNKLDGHFVWDVRLPNSTKLAKCHILIEGASNRPVIKWNFKEGMGSLEEIWGECTFIDSKKVKFLAHLQHDEKNTASMKMEVSLAPLFVNGKIIVDSADLQKLVYPFLPNARGSLNLKAYFEEVSSFERGHITIDGQGSISDTNFHVPIDINISVHNGLGVGEVYLKKGHYQQSPLDAHFVFNSTPENVHIEKCKLQLKDLQLNLLKPAIYHFEQGLSQAYMQFCGGKIEIGQLKFGQVWSEATGFVKFNNIQLRSLKVFFGEHDIGGTLNGEVQKIVGKPLTVKLSALKGIWKKHQNEHTYNILENLSAVLDVKFEEDAWQWNLKVKDSEKIDIETYGKANVQSSLIDAYFKGLIRLRLLTDWLATDDRIYGDISGKFRAVGQLNSPVLEGNINLDNGLYENSDVGTFYQNITIRAKAKGKRLLITRFDAQDVTKSTDPNQGQLRGEGWIDFTEPFSPLFNIPMHLYHLRIAQNDGFISDASGTLTIVGRGAEVGCKGGVTLEKVTYFLESSVESKIPKIIDRSAEKNRGMKKKEKVYSTVFPLDILIHNPPGSFKVVGAGANTLWKGDLYVRKSIANPFLIGTVYLHQGNLDVLGKVLHITHGEITFVDNDRNNPRLNIRAVKKLEDGTIVAIEIKGTGDNTIVDFTSTPSMPKEEVLALLLFGKKLGEISVLQSVQLAELAKSDDDGRGFFEQMRTNFGFDQFEFKTTTRGGASPTDEDATPQERAEAKTNQAVRIGKEFGKVQVAIEQGAGSETSKLVVSTPLGKNLALQGDVGAAQNTGVGISWIKRY